MADDTYETDFYVSGMDGVREYRIPSMILTTQGTLLAVCDARVDRPGDAINNIDQVIRRSHNSGQTWSPMRRVVSYPGDEAAADPSLLQDRRTGTIWLFYVYCPGENGNTTGPPATRRLLLLHCVASHDDGRTWSEPRNISEQVADPSWNGLWAGPGRGIQTRAGRLIIPCSVREPGTHVIRSYLVYSDDHGETWLCSSMAGRKISEPTVVERGDGSLLVNARNQSGGGCRRVVISSDGGEKWSEVRDQPVLIEPVCQGCFIRYSSARDGGDRDRLLFSNPASSTKGDRRNMTVRLSYDEGESWPVARTIYPGPSRYSCMAVLEDGTVGLLYERDSFRWEDSTDCNRKIAFLRFSVEWLTNGRDCPDPPQGV